MDVKTFFDIEYKNYASYDNYRNIASFIDGLKPSSRKVIYTIRKISNKDKIKVANLQSIVAAKTQYLHGENSLYEVIVGLAQDFSTSNNLPLLKALGSFGSRLNPHAAAGRYIYTNSQEYLDKIFLKEDDEILIPQYFEGFEIEPKFFVPVLPLVLINGSSGIGNGHAHKILPRSIESVKKLILDILEEKKEIEEPLPYFNGFTGKIIKTEKSSFEILGRIEKITSNKIEVYELPVGFSYESAKEHFQTLEENGIIKSFQDLCDVKKDKFRFSLNVDKSLTKLTEYEILNKLKLIKRVTENYTLLDENNSIKIYDTIIDIVKDFVKIKLSFLEKRKNKILENLKTKIKKDSLKYKFISAVISEKIKINGKKKSEIISEIKENLGEVEDNDLDLLLNIPIFDFSLERKTELYNSLKKMTEQFNTLKQKDVKEIWKEDIEEFFKSYLKINKL